MNLRRWAPWVVIAVVLVGALAIGARETGPPPTDAERAHAIARTVRCPMCEGQAASDSDAPSAVGLRADIARRVELGETDDEIRQAYVASYGTRILMNPPRSGIAGLVWALPVAALIVAVAALVAAFRRWSSGPATEPTDADRDIVERARHRPMSS